MTETDMRAACLLVVVALFVGSCATIPDVFALRAGAGIEELRASNVRPLRVTHTTHDGHAVETWTYARASFTFIDGLLVEWSGK